MASPRTLQCSIINWLDAIDIDVEIEPPTLTRRPQPPPEQPSAQVSPRVHLKRRRQSDAFRPFPDTYECDISIANMPATPPSTAGGTGHLGLFGTEPDVVPEARRSSTRSPTKKRRVELPPEAAGLRGEEMEGGATSESPLRHRHPVDSPPPHRIDPDRTPVAASAGPSSASRRQYRGAALQYSRRTILRPSSPGKRSSSPVKSVGDLQLLEKPVQVVELGGRRRKDILPEDVQELARDISSHVEYRFVPELVRREFVEMLDRDVEDVPEHWFRRDDDTSEQRHAALWGELRRLRSIHLSAVESSELGRSEPAWNTKVHQPLLDLAMDGDPGSEEMRGGCRVTAEYVSTATLTGDCIPRLRAQSRGYADPTHRDSDETSSNTGSLLACSATSTDTASTAGDTGDVFLEETLRSRMVHDGNMHSKAGSKKVDFALVAVPARSTELNVAIQHMIDSLAAKAVRSRQFAGIPEPSHSINPTAYAPLVRRPIASMIETKTVTSSRDPLVQLGFMVAALHRRLQSFQAESLPLGTLPAIITVPLISVVDHDWKLFFACDRRSHIVRASFVFMSTAVMESTQY